MVFIVAALQQPVGFGRDDRLSAFGFNSGNERIGIVGFIRCNTAWGRYGLQQGLCLADVAGLSGGQDAGGQLAWTFYNRGEALIDGHL